NIDHHITNARFGKINYIDEEASAVGEQVYRLIRHMGGVITKDIATLLYMSVMADTGSFRYSNTKAQTFQVASELVEMGASPSAVAQTYFENQTAGAIKLMGKVLDSLHLEDGGSWVWSEISQADYKAAGGEQNEPEGLVSTMRGIRGVEVSALMHEVPEGGLRVGIRSKGNVDVSAIAKELGGGGHHNASGAYMRGNYEEQKRKVLEALERHMERFRKS
ncbi:MAG: bifunctional oligoribonuclease/PAP phosphatase NrnA, partial [bacterium]